MHRNHKRQFQPELEFPELKITGIFWKLEIFHESQTLVTGEGTRVGDVQE